jgi:hypothetical protein
MAENIECTTQPMSFVKPQLKSKNISNHKKNSFIKVKIGMAHIFNLKGLCRMKTNS